MEGSEGGILAPLIMLGITVFIVAAMWKVFSKADKPGWAAIVPIYNVIVLLQIAGRPMWWLLLMFIPFVNIVVALVVAIDLAKAYGKGTGFGFGLFFLGFVFYPILGFGDAEYIGAPAR
jgi:hypothetical protein